MELAPILILGGVVIFAGLYLWLNGQRVPAPVAPADDSLLDIPGAASGDGVFVARGHGQLVYVNEVSRRWLGMNGDAPDLEAVARQVAPASSFLDLFAGETQASFQLAGRWVEASSYRIPAAGETRTVVLVRPLGAATAQPEALDLALAVGVINEIGETINASLSVEQVLQALLTIVLKAVPADAGEICLWDEDAGVLLPRGWVGDMAYVLALAESGGVYRPDEGISGWIKRHRQPVLVANRDDATSVRPRLAASAYHSFAAIPLLMGERFVGTFELASERVGGLAQADLALLQAVGKPIATAIYNAELYGEQVRRLDDISRLQAAAQDPRAGAGGVYAALGEQIARLTSADVCGVLLYDERKRALVAEAPFFGLPAQVIQGYSIPLPDDGAAHDIFFDRDYWLSNDLTDDPLVEALNMQTLVHAAGVYNTALMPLQIGSERIGMLQVGNKRTHGGFKTRDIQSLRILSAQASVVVQNVLLVQTEQQVDTELAGLQEMTHAIGALRHEGEFYADITGRIARLMGLEMVGILLDDGAGGLVSRPPFYGVDDALASGYRIDLKPDYAFSGIWDEDDAWYSNRVPSDPVIHQAGLAEALAAMGVSKALFAVLSVGGRRVGMVQVANKRDGGDFSERDARLLLIFATQAAAMIENARLYREAQRRADEANSLRRVAELSGAINTSNDPFAPALAQVAGLLESPLAFVSTLSAETGALVTEPRNVHGLEMALRLAQDTYGDEAEGRATLTRRPQIINDLSDVQTPAGYREMALRLGLARLLVVPLLVGERALGEVVVANRDAAYSDDDRRLLMALAVQLAAALDRVRLQEATGQNLSRRLHELDAIARVSNELNLTLEFDRVLDVIRREALAATEATGCTIALVLPRADWHDAATPELDRRVGDPLPSAHLAAVERVAVQQGGEPVRLYDYAESGFTPLPAHARSAVAAAIISADEPIGVLHLFHDQPQHFDAQAATFAATLAAKAALGYANAQRYNESLDRSARLRRRVEQLNQIFELGQMAQADISVDTMLEAFAYSIQQSAGWDVVMMLLADHDAGVLRRVAQAGLPVETYERSRARTLALADTGRLLRDEFRISESYLLPLDKVAQWYVSGIEALGGGFEGKRTLYPRNRQDWRDGDMMIVPLHGPGGGLIGLMSLDRPFNNRRPERSDVEVLEIFAHQAATTLENIRLFNQAEAQTQRLSLLNRVSLALSQSLDNENILETALREIAQMLDAEHGRAYIFEGDARLARVVVDYPRGEEPPSGLLDLDDAPALLAVSRTLQPLVLDDVAQAAQTDASVEAIASAGVLAYVAFPVAVGGEAVGVFELEWRSVARPIAPEQVDLGVIIANQTAIALQNANLLEQTLVRTREMETLLEAAQATSFTLDLDAVFSNAARLTLQALDMDTCAILLYFPAEDALEVEIELSRDEVAPMLTPGTRLRLSDYPVRQRALDRRFVVLAHADDEDLDASEREALQATGGHTRLLVPLVTRDQTMGLMLVDLRDAYRTVTHRDIRMTQALAATAATAIENARLSSETTAQVEELLVINDISRAFSATMDVEAMVRTMHAYLPELVQADEVYLALYDAENMTLHFPVAVRHGEDVARPEQRLMRDEVSYVIRNRQLLSLGGAYSLDEMQRMLKIESREPELQAYLGVPLISGDAVLGVLAVLNTSSRRAFGLNEQRVLTTIASQFSASVQNARLFAQVRGFADELNQAVQDRTIELQEERDRLEALYQITSELAGTLDMDRVLASALDMVAGAVRADEGVILLLNLQTRQLYTRASYLDATGAAHPAETLGAWLLNNVGAVVIDDLHALDYWDASRPGADAWRSALAVLLESSDQPQGAMIFLSREPGAFTEPQLRLVAAAANQVATAINNADLYTLIREQAERMGTLLRAEHEEAEKSSAILESIADGVVLADARGEVVLFNPAAERILGVSRDEALGQPFTRLAGLFGGESSAQLRTVGASPAQSVDLSVERLEIGARIINARVSPVRSANQLLGTVSVFRDVTRDVEVDRMKSDFISNVSHELRTPMTSIKGYADLLLMGAGGPVVEQQRRFLETIKANADRLTALLNDLLNISRLDSGAERLQLEAVDVGEVAQSVVGNLAAQARFAEKPLRVDVRIAPDLPPVQADRARLTQILTNLVDNAFNYTYAGGSITIEADLRLDKPHVQIAVRDTGIGIPEAFRERVWGRFERYEAHALVMDVAGTGLGLSIARELVNMHGGDIWFESVVDVGTTFYVSLPLVAGEA